MVILQGTDTKNYVSDNLAKGEKISILGFFSIFLFLFLFSLIIFCKAVKQEQIKTLKLILSSSHFSKLSFSHRIFLQKAQKTSLHTQKKITTNFSSFPSNDLLTHCSSTIPNYLNFIVLQNILQYLQVRNNTIHN